MSSLEQSILAAILTRLNGTALGVVTRPATLTVERSRLREMAPTQLPCVSIYPLEATTERKGFLSETTLTVKIAIWVKGSASVPVDQDVDPIWLWVHQQLIAEESLGGLCLRIQPEHRAYGFALHQSPFGDLDLHFLITYRHQSANPAIA